MIENINDNNEPRYCKKCGGELPSTEKHKLCLNCRIKRGNTIRNIALWVISVGGTIALGKQLNKNSDDILNEKQEDEGL